MWPFKKPSELTKLVVESLLKHPEDWEMSELQERRYSHWPFETVALLLKHNSHSQFNLIDKTPSTFEGWKFQSNSIEQNSVDSRALSKAVMQWRKHYWKKVLIKETEDDKLLRAASKEVESLLK
jgi:hypothetical protein